MRSLKLMYLMAVLALSLLLSAPLLAADTEDRPENAIKNITVERYDDNPLIVPEQSDAIGDSVHYPSVIKVPDWVDDPLGRYYMYFSSHSGDTIRLAYSDDPLGPWNIHEPGALRNEDLPAFPTHLASPDVHVHEDERVIRMYFQGKPKDRPRSTGVAHSTDGLNFEGTGKILSRNWFRRFDWEGKFYAVATPGKTKLLVSDQPDGPFEEIMPLLRRRHTGIIVKDHYALIFYSRRGDKPERILVSTMDLRPDPEDWSVSEPVEVMRPEEDYEGANQPVRESEVGSATNVHEVRDPYIFEDDGQLYMYYSIAGETGIAVAMIDIEL